MVKNAHGFDTKLLSEYDLWWLGHAGEFKEVDYLSWEACEFG